MKKYLSLFVISGLVLSFSLASFAQADDHGIGFEAKTSFKAGINSDQSGFKDSIKSKEEAFKAKIEAERTAFEQSLKTEKETFKTEIQKLKEDWKNSNPKNKADFCEKATAITTVRFQEAISKLEAVQAKVSAEITVLHNAGKDTTAATASLNLSTQKLADAKAKLATVKALIPANCSNMTSDLFAQIKQGARDAKDLLKESKQNLHLSIEAINLINGDENN